MVVPKNETTRTFIATFGFFPDLQEYRTKDLFEQATDHPGWFRYRGRTDDLIVLSNGEKIDPIPLETVIRSHPIISSALIVGEWRFAPSLLVELREGHWPKNEMEQEAVIDQINSVVEEANKIAPGFSKISRSMILFASPDKPFRRAGKGTIQRQLTVRDYSEALNDVYTKAEDGLLLEGVSLDESKDQQAVRRAIREICGHALQTTDLGDDDNLFDRGMDSFLATIVVQRLKALLRSSAPGKESSNIKAQFVYTHPSINKLTGVFTPMLTTSKANGVVQCPQESQKQRIEAMLEKYTNNLPIVPRASKITNGSMNRAQNQPWTVLITGTTGSLGSYILNTLLSMPAPHVAKVYCLNRSVNSRQRQQKSNALKGLNVDFDDERVKFLQADLSKPDLGLGSEVFATLLKDCTLIVHASWKVNFNLSLESFEDQLLGVCNLLGLSAHSRGHAPLVFLSSISTANYRSTTPDSRIPEEILHDPSLCQELGYAGSKYIAERLLDYFSKSTGITTAVLRTGQIAGPLGFNGVWQKHEWFPSMIASSKHLGVLPESLHSDDCIDWLPVDVSAEVILDLSEAILKSQDSERGHSDGTTVYNLVNPNIALWSNILPTVHEQLGGDSSVKIVPSQDWADALEQSASASHGFITDANPALKLLDYFKGLFEDQRRVIR